VIFNILGKKAIITTFGLMKNITLLVLGILCFGQLTFAANGDSTVVRVWDKFHMNNYGAFDKKALLPPATQKSQRIWLKYTLGCTANGQCEWDYDIALFARHKTGAKDSTLKQAPYLKVNNVAKDSVGYSTDTTWVNTFNTVTKRTDSIPSAKLLITLFADSTTKPLQVTDTISGYTANYYRYMFDSTGKKTDSSWVAATHTIYQHLTPYYSVFDVYSDFELGRLISPYAKAFPKNFQYEYVYDVTDYAKYLNDSTELRIFYSGYSYGFTATWDFIYIEGTPAKEVIEIQNIYNGGYQYGASPSIEASLIEKPFTVPADAASVKAKMLISGHGGESNENCSEFCPKNYTLLLNNQQIAKQLVWRDDCGANPITAQGGTWIYDRANWCPGETIHPFEYNLNVAAGSNNTINMDMDPYTANGYASYKVAFQLIYYKSNSYQIDASIEDILAPSKNNWYSKSNPICDNAKIILKNWGAQPLTDAWITCKMGNGTEMANHWTGNLQYGEEAEVSLPNLKWPTDLTDNTFKVWITAVNGKQITADENPTNNSATSTFDLPITLPKTFIIETKTNLKPQQNAYTIKDSKGNIYKTRTFTAANTMHRDTITLAFGCYTFQFNDDNAGEMEGSNGLGWWAAPGEGTGSLRIVTPTPTQVLKTFSVDFGTFTQLNFRVQHPVGLAEQTLKAENIKVFPSPASDILYTEGAPFTKAVLMDISGKEVASFSDVSAGLNIQLVPTGIYILQLTTADNQVVSKKVSIQK
jgi:hypothetical protein